MVFCIVPTVDHLPPMSTIHLSDPHLRVYSFPEGYTYAYNDAFFHHESDRTPVAITSDCVRVTKPSRVCKQWHVAAPVMSSETAAPLSADELTLTVLKSSGAVATVPISTTCERATRAMHPRGSPGVTVVPITRDQLAPLHHINFALSPHIMTVATPSGRVSALFDGTQYQTGTYVLYVGSSGLLTLDMDASGYLVGGHYQVTAQAHHIRYENEDVASTVGLSLEAQAQAEAGVPVGAEVEVSGLFDKAKRKLLPASKTSASDLHPNETSALDAIDAKLTDRYNALYNAVQDHKTTHSYNERTMEYTTHVGSGASVAVVQLLETELESLKDMGDRYADDYKRWKQAEKIIVKRIRKTSKTNVKLARVPATYAKYKGMLKVLDGMAKGVKKVKQNLRASQGLERVVADTSVAGPIGAGMQYTAAEILQAIQASAVDPVTLVPVEASAEDLDYGVHIQSRGKVVTLRALESHAPVYCSRQIKNVSHAYALVNSW